MKSNFFFYFVVDPPVNCRPGWYSINDRCFFISLDLYDKWFPARFHCQRRGGRLAITNNILTMKRLGDILQNLPVGTWPIHVGASALEDRRWMWVDNTNVSSRAWKSTLSGFTAKLCGVLKKREYSNSTWNDFIWQLNQEECTTRIRAICEKPASKW